MTEAQDLEEFSNDHPHPDKAGINSLFKFSRFDENNIEYLSHLFIEGKLYHSVPENFNDPFECRPHFNWPNSPSKVQGIRKHLIKVLVKNGYTRKNSNMLVSKNMGRPGFIQDKIYSSIQRVFSEIRIASFTTKKENLLFWSHYADSHKGFCVEYDSTLMPISYAFKVQYKDEYPEVIYPSKNDVVNFKPALIKSTAWEYEEEYRIIFVPEAFQPKNDGTSLILNDKEMKNVYLGANMTNENKKTLVDMIERGPFNPGIWDVSLSKSSFKLKFNERK